MPPTEHYPFGTVIEHPGYRGTILLVLGAAPSGSLVALVLADADDRQPWELGSFHLVADKGWIVLERPDVEG